MTTKNLSFNDIVGICDVQTKQVEVPEWGGIVVVKGMSKRDQQLMRHQASGPGGPIDTDLLEKLWLAHCLADPAITVEQAGQLLEKSAAAVDKVLTAILEINGLSDEMQKDMVRRFHTGDEKSEA